MRMTAGNGTSQKPFRGMAHKEYLHYMPNQFNPNVVISVCTWKCMEAHFRLPYMLSATQCFCHQFVVCVFCVRAHMPVVCVLVSTSMQAIEWACAWTRTALCRCAIARNFVVVNGQTWLHAVRKLSSNLNEVPEVELIGIKGDPLHETSTITRQLYAPSVIPICNHKIKRRNTKYELHLENIHFVNAIDLNICSHK